MWQKRKTAKLKKQFNVYEPKMLGHIICRESFTTETSNASKETNVTLEGNS